MVGIAEELLKLFPINRDFSYGDFLHRGFPYRNFHYMPPPPQLGRQSGFSNAKTGCSWGGGEFAVKNMTQYMQNKFVLSKNEKKTIEKNGHKSKNIIFTNSNQ